MVRETAWLSPKSISELPASAWGCVGFGLAGPLGHRSEEHGEASFSHLNGNYRFISQAHQGEGCFVKGEEEKSIIRIQNSRNCVEG